MIDQRVSRRSLLLGTVMVGGGVLLAGPARAFSVVQGRDVDTSTAFALSNRCGPASEHAAIMSSLEARLAGSSGPSGSTVSASEVCPICGCPVTATRTIR